VRLKKGKAVYRLPPNDGVLQVLVRRTQRRRGVTEPIMVVPMFDVRRVDTYLLETTRRAGHPFLASPVDRELRLYPAPDFGGHLIVTYRPMPRIA